MTSHGVGNILNSGAEGRAPGGYNRRMERKPLQDEETIRLRQREAEILQRIERLKRTMHETKELNTLAFKAKLYKEAQEELRRVQEKLAGLA